MTTVALDDYRRRRNAATDAARRRRRDLKLLRGEPTSMVDPNGVVTHVRQLLNLGWSSEAIAAATGGKLTGNQIRDLAAGKRNRIQRKSLAVLDVPAGYRVPVNVPDACLVPSDGAVRRVQALLAIGWTHAELSARGVCSRWLTSTTRRQARAGKWRHVDDVYRQLCMTPGPSSAHTRTRAAAAGYLPPLAWDDIDDPDETPRRGTHRTSDDAVDTVVVQRRLDGQKTRHLTSAEAGEVVRIGRARGLGGGQIERLTGVRPDRHKTGTTT